VNDGLADTEARNEALRNLDAMSSDDLVLTIASDQVRAVQTVVAGAHELARVVDAIVNRLSRGGTLHYVGAGTSGRLGVLDASEMPPTFGVPPNLVCAHIAGGEGALRNAIEGAEDDGEAGVAAMRDHVDADDAVVGISASGGAAYVVDALAFARAAGALTVAITNSAGSRLGEVANEAIVLETGAEVVTGSTRLKAGTAQKVALNTISTAVMVRLGKVYENLMVDVVATNVKLRKRALLLVQELADVSDERATDLLAASGGSVKVATVVAWRKTNASDARAILDAAGGMLRRVRS
jgi:N-acetylmuramic acid 6-phosphate etherase